jgi:hypothetical protein
VPPLEAVEAIHDPQEGFGHQVFGVLLALDAIADLGVEPRQVVLVDPAKRLGVLAGQREQVLFVV